MICDIVSSVSRWDKFEIMRDSISSLSELIRSRMRELGIETQAELARRSGLTAQDINRFFDGGTKLPRADKRRALAKALGLSHLDLLVAAGELTEDEARGLGGGLTERDPDERKQRLYELIRTAVIPDPFYVGLFPMLQALQPGARQSPESVERSDASDR